jgi:hypothetical protein
MTNKMVKKEEVKPVKKYTIQEAKNFILECAKTPADPDLVLKQFANDYMPLIYSNDDCKEEEITKKLTELSLALGLETGHALMESVTETHIGLALQMKRDLQEEFNCKTPSEKALVDLAVSSYLSKLHYTKLLRLNQTTSSSDHNGYRNSASKEIDRAHRQFISTIETLKFMKQPSLKVNIKTNNAFVGENQQFNNNVENNEAK